MKGRRGQHLDQLFHYYLFSPITLLEKIDNSPAGHPTTNHEFLSDSRWACPLNEQWHGDRYKGEL